MALDFGDLIPKGSGAPSPKPAKAGRLQFTDLVPQRPATPPPAPPAPPPPPKADLGAKAGKAGGQVLTTLTRGGESAIRLLGTLLATPFVGPSDATRAKARAFVAEPLKTDALGLPAGKSLPDYATEMAVNAEQTGSPASRKVAKALSPVVALGSQYAAGLGDPINLLLAKGAMLRSPNLSLAEMLVGSSDRKAPDSAIVKPKETAGPFDFAKPHDMPDVSQAPENVGKVNNPARSVESRIENLGPQGRQIAQRFREADTVGLVNTGKVTKVLDSTGLASLGPKENALLGDVLRGQEPVAKLSPKARKLYDAVDAYRQSVPARAREYGVKVRTARGKTFDFPEGRQNYFPQNTPPIESLRKGTVRSEVIDNAVRSGRFQDKVDARKALDSYIELIQKNGRTKNDYFAQKLVAEGQAKTVAEAKGKVLRFFRASRQQRYGNLERARELNFPFYDPNPQRVIPRYVANVERRLAEAQVLGPNLEKVDTLLGSIKNPETQPVARLLVKVARGANEPGEPSVEHLLQRARGFSTLRLGPLSAITNLGQNVNSLLASDLPSALKGVVRGLRPIGKELGVESGAIAESSLRQVEKMAGGDTGIVGRYLRGTGFTASERFNRVTSANTAWYYAQKITKRLLVHPEDNFARSELKALELNPDTILKQGGLTHNDLLRAVKVFVDRTQFRSRPIDLPASFTKSAIGQNISQFKTFSYQQGRFLAKQTIGLLRSGNPGHALRTLGLLATVFPLTGEAIADVRSILQGRPRTSKGLARYFEDLTYVGGLGLLTDTIQSLKYNPSEFLLGPSAAFLTRNLQDVYKGFAGTLNQGDKRQLVGQVPLVGPFLSSRLFPPKQP